MGMGDVKPKYAPAYFPVLCDVSGLKFAPCSTRECHEPRVMKKYGKSNTCHVSIYVCSKCKYHTTTPFCGAVGCGYKEESDESVQR